MPRVTKPESCVSCPYKWKYLNLLKDSDIDNIQNNCLIIHFKKGETICKQGTEVSHALYLAKGMVKLYIEGQKNLILKLIQAGTYIDLQNIFGDKVYRYSVAAVENCMVCMINSDFLIDMAKENNNFLLEVTKTISTSTNYVYKKISDLGRKKLQGRLADTLLYLSEEIYHSNELTTNLTRKELAELSSMSMENAVRILAQFKKDDIIETDGRFITIKQPEVLRQIGMMN